jgi:hypothetical protein
MAARAVSANGVISVVGIGGGHLKSASGGCPTAR